MLRRIDPVMATGQHRNRAARNTGAMCRLVDAARQSRDDDKAGLAKLAGQRACEFQPRARRIA